MKTAIVTLSSKAPYSQGRYHEAPKKKGESVKEYEERTWLDKAHLSSDGNMIIPSQQIKNCIREAAKYLSIKVEGKGKATYTKYFDSGLLIDGDMDLGIKKDKIEREKVFMQMAQNKTRVVKYFPIIHKWSGTVRIMLLEDAIPKDIFETVMRKAGLAIGLGRYRVRLGGAYGRFFVDNIDWEETED